MSAPRTLSQFRSMVRELADMETASPSTDFVDNTELDARINEAVRQLYDLLVLARGQEYYASSQSFASTSGQSDYSLPINFYQLLGVRVTDGTSWAHLPTWQYQELAPLLQLETAGGGVSSIHQYRYRLQANKLAIHPYPSGSNHTFYVDYVPTCPVLMVDGDAFDGINGWEKWAALTAAIDLANKEENYELTAALTSRRADIQMQIASLAGSRDAARPARIQDTRRDWAGGGHPDYDDWNAT